MKTMEPLFEDIFSKIESHKPKGSVVEVWKRIDDNRFQCKITGKELNRVQFERYQRQREGRGILWWRCDDKNG
jgi:hypothetical protein